jgi:hypothetical protein
MERDFPDMAANSTFSALERASKIPTAPETSRSVLQHSKSHPRMLESMYPCLVPFEFCYYRSEIKNARIDV